MFRITQFILMKTKLSLILITSFLVFSLFDLPLVTAESTYTVKKGDTLWTISKKFRIELSEMIGANPQLTDPDIIYPGQIIHLPAIRSEDAFEDRFATLINRERQKNGLSPVQTDSKLSQVALYKSRDMRDAGYFSHRSPTYGSPDDMLKSFHISYSQAAENLAAGQMSFEEVVQEWLDSPVHRNNILNPSYTHMGVGYAKGGAYGTYWTQLFITK
ncbi:CAP domain-containing protein [Rossellomorea aquimaris]|uniref:CAP domain-containing protein n=1 Tax=Rossellomorea TaxID=2837508 RepID=UPI001CD77D52|nr:CAP domain-containing protein [Rossellomorea aquimaris]MCA1061512.1 CAP domain-containing protein [Rossellomorea aquimaris]